MNLETYIKTPLEIKNELLQYFSPSDNIIIFDVGACEGEDSIRYSNLFPNSNIYSFEPIPNNFIKAKKNLETYNISNCHIFELALSDSNGHSDIYVSKGHPGYLEKKEDWDYGNKSSSLLPAKELNNYYNWLNLDEKIKVETKTIKDFCVEKKIEKIDFLHMDVQGAELIVLNGAKDFIDKIKLIWLEVESVELYENQPLKESVIEYLVKNNFSIIKDTCSSVSGDILCVKN